MEQLPPGTFLVILGLLGVYVITRNLFSQILKKDALDRFIREKNIVIKTLQLSVESLPLKAYLDQVFDLIFSIPELQVEPRGAIFEVIPGKRALRMLAERNLSDPIRKECAEVRFGHCLCGKAAEQQTMVFKNHVDEDHDTNYEGMPDHGHYCLPISYKGELQGVLVLYTAPNHFHSFDETEFLRHIAASLAGALKRHRLAKKLSAQDLHMEKMTQSSHDAFIAIGAEGSIAFWNLGAERILGFKRDEIIGQHYTTLIPDRYLSLQVDKQISPEGARFIGDNTYEMFIKHREGFEIPISFTFWSSEVNEQRFYSIIARDISFKRQVDEQIWRSANFDSVTKLPNRNLFFDRLRHEIGVAKRSKKLLAVMYCDLDKFKRVNDTFGHPVGDTLIKHADQALYRAKEAGRNRYEFYNHDLEKQQQRVVAIEQALGKPDVTDNMSVVFQPILHRKNKKIFAVEALLRWSDENLGGSISPNEFIPIAEQSGAILKLGKFVLKKALSESIPLREIGIPVSVNISASQINSDFLPTLRQVTADYELGPNQLILELTESRAVENLASSSEVFSTIEELSIEILLDDFGTGYSALSSLSEIPAKVIKLDKAFMLKSQEQWVELIPMFEMLKGLGKRIVVEGVETEQAMVFLKEHSIEYVQGFLFSPPRDISELLPQIKKGKWVGNSTGGTE